MIRFRHKVLFLCALFTGTAYADIDNINIGGDLMFAYFFGDNYDLYDGLNDEVDFFRTEFHLTFQADLDDNIMTRITLEGDRAMNSYNIGNINNLDDNIGDLEIFIEEAFLKVADIGGSGFSLSAGRQFLNFGDDPAASDFNRWWGAGFIIADSRTNDPLYLYQLGDYEIDPFDAIVITHQSETTRVDLMHARDVEDDLLGPNRVTDDDASLTAIYASYFGFDNHQIDLYATYNDQEGPLGSLHFEGDKWIVGGRTAGDITEEIAYKAELAYQFEKNDRNVSVESDAFGFQTGLNYHPHVNLSPNVGLLYSYLQQDGLANSMSGFAAPFEGKTYGSIFEGLNKKLSRVNPFNPFTNMHVFNVYGGFNPLDDVALSLDFYYFLLDEKLALPNGQKTKDDAGIEIDSQIDYRFNRNLNTFFGGGVFIPGEATEELMGDDDQAYFVRAGIKVSF